MNRRSTLICVGLLLLGTALSRASAEENASAPESESLWVTAIARVGTGDQFVAATADGLLLREAAVYSFSASDPNQRTKIYTHPAAVWCVASTSSGDRIVSVDYRGNLVVFDQAAAQSNLHEKAFERWCQAMIISPDDRLVVAGNEAGKVMVFEIDSRQITQSAELDGHAVTGLALSPDGTQLAASDGGGHVHLLKWPGLEPIGKIDVSGETAWCVTFVENGSHLLVGSGDRQLYRCEAKPDAKAEVIAKGTDWITDLAVSPSGQVVAAEVGGKLHFPSGSNVDTMEAKSGVWAICWSGDSELLVGTRKDGIVSASRAWKWTEPKPAAAPAATQPAGDAAPAETAAPAEAAAPTEAPAPETAAPTEAAAPAEAAAPTEATEKPE
jgi:WD40 repeat protein